MGQCWAREGGDGSWLDERNTDEPADAVGERGRREAEQQRAQARQDHLAAGEQRRPRADQREREPRQSEAGEQGGIALQPEEGSDRKNRPDGEEKEGGRRRRPGGAAEIL